MSSDSVPLSSLFTDVEGSTRRWEAGEAVRKGTGLHSAEQAELFIQDDAPQEIAEAIVERFG